jgi:KaiC/GvpD/RAD55 family RecA-like ATPase
MKTRTRKAKRPAPPRRTLAKAIEAQQDMQQANELAMYGRILAPIERKVWQYLFFKEGHNRCIAAGQDENNMDRRCCYDSSRFSASELLSSILEAIDRKDGTTIRLVADAVENYGKRQRYDDMRAYLLALKSILTKKDETITLRKLAEILREPETEDSFAVLRRMAKRLKFPLAQDRVGRPRKGDK